MALTRFAPSPTGALHLGNARSFLITYILARKNKWKTLLRIEDLDGPRVRKDSDKQAMADLQWLGITSDTGPVYQSQRLPFYSEAVGRLLRSALAYPCVCSRSEVDAAASAPHATDGSVIYPGTCRGRFSTVEEAQRVSGKLPCIRFRMPDRAFTFVDGFHGPTCIDGASLGDFPIQKADGTPAYQLACAVDDAETGITQVVRGDDLLDSTPRQIALLEALGLASRIPTYTHLPLVIGTDGRRLAKRHGDTRLSAYRNAGRSASEVLLLLAGWCGVETEAKAPPRRADDLVAGFDLGRLSRECVVYDAGADPLLQNRTT